MLLSARCPNILKKVEKVLPTALVGEKMLLPETTTRRTTQHLQFYTILLAAPPSIPAQGTCSTSQNTLPRYSLTNLIQMHLMYNTAPDGTRIYTLKKVLEGTVTKSAHPARFSPDDKYSRHRVTLKKRYGLLLTQQSESNTVPGSGLGLIIFAEDEKKA